MPAIRTVILKPTTEIPADAVYNSHINIRGKITQQIQPDEYLVEGEKEADTDFARAQFLVTDQTFILDQGAGCSFRYAKAVALKKGQMVEVTFNSPIQPGDPVKAEASQVVLLDPLPLAKLSTNLKPFMDGKDPSIRGSIKMLTVKNDWIDGFLIDGRNEPPGQPAPALKTKYDRAYVSLLPCTRIFIKQGEQYSLADSNQLQEGQQVDVLFFGRVATSYPVQAQAMEIIIHVAPAPTPTPQIKVYMPAIQK